MRLKPVLIGVAALAALALLIRQVTQAVRRTFGGRPGVVRLARATPAYQNGLTLMDITSVSPDRSYSFSEKGQQDSGRSAGAPEVGTGLWIKLPLGVSLPMNCWADDSYYCQNPLTLTARASDGREIPMRWRASSARSSDGPTYILASIPAGYPDTVRWADVTLEDHHGDMATWRILHLPPMQHVLAPPVTPRTTFHQGNITLTARAYRSSDPNGRFPRLLCDVTGTIVNAPYKWNIGPMSFTHEWEPPGYAAPDSTQVFRTTKDARNKVTIQVTRQPLYRFQLEPYLSADHWVRLNAPLQEYATYDETVVFHNVSFVNDPGTTARFLAGAQAQTVTSPSGVTVTLVDAQHQPLTFGWRPDGFNLVVHYPQSSKYPSLPRSPLWRKHNGLINVYLKLPKPYRPYDSDTEDLDGFYRFSWNKAMPITFARFPVIIHQWVRLRTIPVTFTLPVEDK